MAGCYVAPVRIGMRLSAADLKQHQLPAEVDAYRKPEGW
jgi:hypothetical protein